MSNPYRFKIGSLHSFAQVRKTVTVHDHSTRYRIIIQRDPLEDENLNEKLEDEEMEDYEGSRS